MVVKGKSSTQKSKPQKSEPKKQGNPKPGNIFDAFAKQMLARIVVFADFLTYYADKKFVAEINTKQITSVPTHYISKGGREQILDLAFHCPLKHGNGSLMAVIILGFIPLIPLLHLPPGSSPILTKKDAFVYPF